MTDYRAVDTVHEQLLDRSVSVDARTGLIHEHVYQPDTAPVFHANVPEAFSIHLGVPGLVPIPKTELNKQMAEKKLSFFQRLRVRRAYSRYRRLGENAVSPVPPRGAVEPLRRPTPPMNVHDDRPYNIR